MWFTAMVQTMVKTIINSKTTSIKTLVQAKTWDKNSCKQLDKQGGITKLINKIIIHYMDKESLVYYCIIKTDRYQSEQYCVCVCVFSEV